MAQNPYINKVEYAGQTLMDLTGDTATPSDVLNGKTFHDRSGAPQTGNLITHNVYDGLDSSSSSDALSANQGKYLNEHKIDTESVAWTPSINGITAYSNLTDSYAVRTGNVVICRCYFQITQANSNDAYIQESCLPAFNKTKKFGTGTWLDNTNDNAGFITGAANNNAWIFNSTTGRHMKFNDYTNRYLYIVYTYTLS